METENKPALFNDMGERPINGWARLQVGSERSFRQPGSAFLTWRSCVEAQVARYALSKEGAIVTTTIYLGSLY